VDAEKASAADTSFFELFQIEPSVDIHLPSLEATYHRLSLKLHPDCNTHADLKTRLHSLEQTAQLNRAYATLSNPQRRALYLLKIYGINLEDSQNPLQAPLSFLNHMLELREQLQQASLSRQTDKLENLERFATEAMEKKLELGCQCLRDGLGHGPPEKLQQAALHLVCVRYWQRFLEDVECFQEELSS